MSLAELIEKIREQLKANAYDNETAVREAIVLPVLQALEWNIHNPRLVVREYSLQGRRVDYALCARPDKPSVIIEVKAVGKTEADTQLFEYAFHAGAPLAILTDGREWKFYLPYTQGSYNERLVRILNLAEQQNMEQVVQVFERYLSFGEIQSKRAFENARKDLVETVNQKSAREAIPHAWQDMLAKPDPELVNLLMEKASSISEYAPQQKDVVSFLKNPTQPAPGHRPPEPVIKRHGNSRASQLERLQPTNTLAKKSRSPTTYQLFGQNYESKSANEAYVNILQTLHARDSTFLERLEPKFVGRTRKNLARQRADISKIDRVLRATLEIAPGWWLNLYLSNAAKERHLKIACAVAGITFGKDLKINFPDTSYAGQTQEFQPTNTPAKKTRRTTYRLFGQNYETKSGKEAYIHIIQTLHKREPSFLERLEPKFAGRTTKYLARRQKDISDRNDTAINTAEKIAPGWWLNINLSNSQKEHRLKIACAVAGITFGKDLIINFPDNS